jgi:hypothetical protein
LGRDLFDAAHKAFSRMYRQRPSSHPVPCFYKLGGAKRSGERAEASRCWQQEPVISVRVGPETQYLKSAMPIKRPEMLDEFTRGFIESLAKPGVQQLPRKNSRKTVRGRSMPRFKPANKKASTVTSSALAAHAISGKRR